MADFVLETPRLVLRPMTAADLDFVAGMLANPQVMRHYPKCYNRDEAADWIARQERRYARHGHGLWLVLERQSRCPVGQVGLLIQRIAHEDCKEVAYLIDEPYWRRGYATEAAAAACGYAFRALRQPRVYALIRAENVPSHGVARRLGMTPHAEPVIHRGFVHTVYSRTPLDTPPL